MSTVDPTQRFSSRVSDYVKYRPSYPSEVVDYLISHGMLTPHANIADIGSGTGLLAEVFLKRGFNVIGVEPNPEMRRAGVEFLASYAKQGHFRSVESRAEETTLPQASIDLITAGQAFHWFDRSRCKTEFTRILKPNGWVALVWNERLINTPFMNDYERLLCEFAVDYNKVDHKQITDAVIAEFFSPSGFQIALFPNFQRFDAPSLAGRLLSSSYAPGPGHPKHQPMLAELEKIFLRPQKQSSVEWAYETKLYVGQVPPAPSPAERA